MRIEVNWADVSFGLILLCVVVVLAVAYYFVEQRRIAAADAAQRRAFERDMADVELPDYNGDTYEWTQESLAYLDDTNLYAGPGVADTAEFPVVPDSTLSGPLPVMDGPLDNDAFLEQLKADNAEFLAKLELQ